jgi:hypothetical protein
MGGVLEELAEDILENGLFGGWAEKVERFCLKKWKLFWICHLLFPSEFWRRPACLGWRGWRFSGDVPVGKRCIVDNSGSNQFLVECGALIANTPRNMAGE